MKRKSFVAELWQDGLRVVVVDCPTRVDAEREIGHYALMYSQDGIVKIERKYK